MGRLLQTQLNFVVPDAFNATSLNRVCKIDDGCSVVAQDCCRTTASGAYWPTQCVSFSADELPVCVTYDCKYDDSSLARGIWPTCSSCDNCYPDDCSCPEWR